MQIDLNQFDAQGEVPSLRISYHSDDCFFYVHRDFYGPMKTFVRICLLRFSEQDLARNNAARRYFNELSQLGTVGTDGGNRLKYNTVSAALLSLISLELGCVLPSPRSPVLPDYESTAPVIVNARQ